MLFGKKFNHILSLKKILLVLLMLISTLTISIIIYIPSIPKSIHYVIGDTAKETMYAPSDIYYESHENKKNNKEKKQQTKKNKIKVFTINPFINETILSNINETISQIQNQNTLYINPQLLKTISITSKNALITMPQQKLQKIKKQTLGATRKLLQEGIKNKNSYIIKKTITKNLILQNIPQQLSKDLANIVTFHIKPNIIQNNILTQYINQEKVKKINYEKTKVKKGQPIFYKNDVITKDHIILLKEISIYKLKPNKQRFFSILFITGLLLFILNRLTYIFKPTTNKIKFILLSHLLIALTCALNLIIINLNWITEGISTYSLIPIAALTILISFLISPINSLFVGIITSILLTIMLNGSLPMITFLLFSSITSTLITSSVSKRSNIVLTGYILGGFNCVFIITTGLLLFLVSGLDI